MSSQTNVKIDINYVIDNQNMQEHNNYKELGIFVYESDIFANLRHISPFFFSVQIQLHVTDVYIGYILNVMRQTACVVFNPIMLDIYAAFFNCMPVAY